MVVVGRGGVVKRGRNKRKRWENKKSVGLGAAHLLLQRFNSPMMHETGEREGCCKNGAEK